MMAWGVVVKAIDRSVGCGGWVQVARCAIRRGTGGTSSLDRVNVTSEPPAQGSKQDVNVGVGLDEVLVGQLFEWCCEIVI